MALEEETPRTQWRMHRLYARTSANSCALRITWQNWSSEVKWHLGLIKGVQGGAEGL